MARSKIKSRSYHDIASTHLHGQIISLPDINFIHLTVSKIHPGQDIGAKSGHRNLKVTNL